MTIKETMGMMDLIHCFVEDGVTEDKAGFTQEESASLEKMRRDLQALQRKDSWQEVLDKFNRLSNYKYGDS